VTLNFEERMKSPIRFGPIEDVAAYYTRLEATPEYATFCRPDADDIRQAKIESTRKRRVRKPTLANVLREAKRAGVRVASFEVAPDGRITVVPGQPNAVLDVADNVPGDANPWDAVLQ
jgi:hypothetical protein